MAGFKTNPVKVPVINSERVLNSIEDMAYRLAGFRKEVLNVNVTGNGTVNIPIFKVTGTIEVIKQVAEIVSITTLTNLTSMYADVWDGTVSDVLTKTTGAALSGAPVGTIFTKDQDITQPYSISLADQGRVLEASDVKLGKPFYVTQKTGDVDTFIRLNFTTTDAPVDFNLDVFFDWRPIDGGSLELVS